MEPLLRGDPQRVGSYTLEGRLGGGGMGQVYLGRSRGGRPVAVKVVREEYVEDHGFRERFRREVDLAMKVGGFWAAHVLDADPDAASPWVASEYIQGPTLAQRVVNGGPLPQDEVRRLAAGLAEALIAIHAARLIHRDLKPGNIILTDDGPRVIDFGISKALDGPTGLTGTGAVVGTPGYMSPEQALGSRMSFAGDVFSLGSVLVYAATGREPFGTGAVHALLYRVVHDEPDLTGLPAGLRPLITACLRKRPEDRPTPDDVLDLLGDVPMSAPAPVASTAPAAEAPTVRHPPLPVTRVAEPPPEEGESEGEDDDELIEAYVLDNTGNRAAFVWRAAFLPLLCSPALFLLFHPLVATDGTTAPDDVTWMAILLSALTGVGLIGMLALGVGIRHQRSSLVVDASGLLLQEANRAARLQWRDVTSVRVRGGGSNLTPTGRFLKVTVELRPDSPRRLPGRSPKRGTFRCSSYCGRRHRERVTGIRLACAAFAPPEVGLL